MKHYVKITEDRFVELVQAERRSNEPSRPEIVPVPVEESEAFALADATVKSMDARIRDLELQLSEKDLRLSNALAEAERFRNGRDERQKERDKERKKVRLLNAEIERLRESGSGDLHDDLLKATVGEFKRLREEVRESTDVLHKICSVASVGPAKGSSFSETVHEIRNICIGYLRKKGAKIQDEHEGKGV